MRHNDVCNNAGCGSLEHGDARAIPESVLSERALPPDLDRLTLAEVICPQCEGDGEVLPHGDVDCDLCVRGEYEGHTIPCPTCSGHGEGLFVPLSLVESGGRLVVETPCGHEGMFADGWSRPLDGMKTHPVGVATGFSRGGGPKYAAWCPGGSRRVVWPTDKEER